LTRAGVVKPQIFTKRPRIALGPGLTQRASGVAAFSSASSAGWRSDPICDTGSALGKCPEDPGTWTAGCPVDLKHAPERLCGPGVEAAPGAAAVDDEHEDARAASPLSLPPLNLFARQHNLSEEDTQLLPEAVFVRVMRLIAQ